MEILTILIVFALIATVCALGMGIVSMVRGGTFDQKHSHHIMLARVGFQGLAFVLLLIALVIAAL